MQSAERGVQYSAFRFLLRFCCLSFRTPQSEFRTMRGPYERLKYDLRRVWECPACKRRERTAGTVTFRHCNCRMKQVDGQPVVMKLVEDGVQRVTPPISIRHEPLPPVSVGVSVEATSSEPPPIVQPESVTASTDPQRVAEFSEGKHGHLANETAATDPGPDHSSNSGR